MQRGTNILSGPSEKSSFPDSSSRSLRVIVVDDNKDAADAMADLLSVAGHKARKMYSGLSLVQGVKDFRPHVVLLDLAMPDMDGYECARAVRQLADPPVLIAVTGYGQERDKIRTKEAGFQYHLVKPVSLSALEEIFGHIS